MEKEIKNKLWNGKEAAFVRCVNSGTLDYFDVPISRGEDFYFGNHICKIAHHLKHDNGIIDGNYIRYDFWFRINVENGVVVNQGHNENGACGAVVDSGYKGFWFDRNTFKILGVCGMLYHDFDYFKGEVVEPKMLDKNKSDAFIESFNKGNRPVIALSRV